MRHFEFLSEDERDRYFVHAPEDFGLDDPPELLGVALGATLYSPATRPALAKDIVRQSARGVRSVVVCLEDSVSDLELADAEANAIAQLRELALDDVARVMVFIRVRHPGQIPMLVESLGEHIGVLSGFIVPKFTHESGPAYLAAVTSASDAIGRRLLVMPVLESPEISFAETRVEALLACRRLIDVYRPYVPAIRVGATDLSGTYGLRRSRELTVWDVGVIAETLTAIVNVFGRFDGDYVITGPVWEYFSSSERLFKPQLRETPFVVHSARTLRAKLIAADLDGLIREVALDRANGLTGKTVIHPTHVAAVHALSVVAHEEHADALDILATEGRGGVAASSYGNKMNESKPHTTWARRTLRRAKVFGVVREGVSFVDLLGAGLQP